MRHLKEIEQLERDYRHSGMADEMLLDQINNLRSRYGMLLVDQNLKEMKLKTNFWQDPDQKLLDHQGAFEPGNDRPSWGLTVQQFSQLQCDFCHKPFQPDHANGVMGGIMILNVGKGKNEHYHGYEDQRNSCFRQAMRELENPKRNPMVGDFEPLFHGSDDDLAPDYEGFFEEELMSNPMIGDFEPLFHGSDDDIAPDFEGLFDEDELD